MNPVTFLKPNVTFTMKFLIVFTLTIISLYGENQKSIHQSELEFHRSVGSSPDVEAPMPQSIGNRTIVIDREVFGYYP